MNLNKLYLVFKDLWYFPDNGMHIHILESKAAMSLNKEFAEYQKVEIVYHI